MVWNFILVSVHMITFATLVIIAKDAGTLHNESKPILVIVIAAGKRHRQTPDHHSTNEVSESAWRSWIISLAFMLERITTTSCVVNCYNSNFLLPGTAVVFKQTENGNQIS